MGWLNKREGQPSVMPLLAQWVRQRPWLAAGIASAAGGVAGLAGGIAAAAPRRVFGTSGDQNCAQEQGSERQPNAAATARILRLRLRLRWWLRLRLQFRLR